ncbi:hypothetical protein [Sulfurimonas sp. HSL3-7]
MTVVLLAAGKTSRTAVTKQLYPVKRERKHRRYGRNIKTVL